MKVVSEITNLEYNGFHVNHCDRESDMIILDNGEAVPVSTASMIFNHVITPGDIYLRSVATPTINLLVARDDMDKYKFKQVGV